MSTTNKRMIALSLIGLLFIFCTSVILAQNISEKFPSVGKLAPFITRGQLAMIEARNQGFDFDMATHTYADVPFASMYYQAIEQLAALNGGSQGFACGGVNEPCDNENRPYYRPNN